MSSICGDLETIQRVLGFIQWMTGFHQTDLNHRCVLVKGALSPSPFSFIKKYFHLCPGIGLGPRYPEINKIWHLL